jgi:hypothetical protein
MNGGSQIVSKLASYLSSFSAISLIQISFLIPKLVDSAKTDTTMGQWSQLDEDSCRLPEGMTRIGYDSDTERYTYYDKENGSYWEGPEGAKYGQLRRCMFCSTTPHHEYTLLTA